MKGRARMHSCIKKMAMASLLTGLAAGVLAWAWQAWTAPESLMRLLNGFSLCS